MIFGFIIKNAGERQTSDIGSNMSVTREACKVTPYTFEVNYQTKSLPGVLNFLNNLETHHVWWPFQLHGFPMYD